MPACRHPTFRPCRHIHLPQTSPHSDRDVCIQTLPTDRASLPCVVEFSMPASIDSGCRAQHVGSPTDRASLRTLCREVQHAGLPASRICWCMCRGSSYDCSSACRLADIIRACIRACRLADNIIAAILAATLAVILDAPLAVIIVVILQFAAIALRSCCDCAAIVLRLCCES